MKISRYTKYLAFEEFFENSERIFEKVSREDFRSNNLKDLYSLCIAPGGRCGGRDKRTLEVFFGSRPFDDEDYRFESETGIPRFGNRLITESGASLSYSRTDSGDVLCILYPAKSKYFSHKEDMIIYKIIKNPCCVLLDEIKIQKHWKDLVSYMHCTSLDGDPTIIDRLKVSWFRFTRPLIVDGKEVSPEIHSVIQKIIEFTLTVGLSGFLLFVIQKFMNKS